MTSPKSRKFFASAFEFLFPTRLHPIFRPGVLLSLLIGFRLAGPYIESGVLYLLKEKDRRRQLGEAKQQRAEGIQEKKH